VVEQLNKINYQNLHIIWGAVEGKDLSAIFRHLPKDALYYFCEASVPRALHAALLQKTALTLGCIGETFRNVDEALYRARSKAGEKDLIFIGGSNFIIAEITGLKGEKKVTAV